MLSSSFSFFSRCPSGRRTHAHRDHSPHSRGHFFDALLNVNVVRKVSMVFFSTLLVLVVWGFYQRPWFVILLILEGLAFLFYLFAEENSVTLLSAAIEESRSASPRRARKSVMFLRRVKKMTLLVMRYKDTKPKGVQIALVVGMVVGGFIFFVTPIKL